MKEFFSSVTEAWVRLEFLNRFSVVQRRQTTAGPNSQGKDSEKLKLTHSRTPPPTKGNSKTQLPLRSPLRKSEESCAAAAADDRKVPVYRVWRKHSERGPPEQVPVLYTGNVRNMYKKVLAILRHMIPTRKHTYTNIISSILQFWDVQQMRLLQIPIWIETFQPDIAARNKWIGFCWRNRHGVFCSIEAYIVSDFHFLMYRGIFLSADRPSCTGHFIWIDYFDYCCPWHDWRLLPLFQVSLSIMRLRFFCFPHRLMAGIWPSIMSCSCSALLAPYLPRHSAFFSPERPLSTWISIMNAFVPSPGTVLVRPWILVLVSVLWFASWFWVYRQFQGRSTIRYWWKPQSCWWSVYCMLHTPDNFPACINSTRYVMMTRRIMLWCNLVTFVISAVGERLSRFLASSWVFMLCIQGSAYHRMQLIRIHLLFHKAPLSLPFAFCFLW